MVRRLLIKDQVERINHFFEPAFVSICVDEAGPAVIKTSRTCEESETISNDSYVRIEAYPHQPDLDTMRVFLASVKPNGYRPPIRFSRCRVFPGQDSPTDE